MLTRFHTFIFVLLCSTSVAIPAIAAPGEFDRSFGQNGIAHLPTDATFAKHVTIDSGGRVLATGIESSAEVLARLTPNGSPDTTFNVSGYIRNKPDGFPNVTSNDGLFIASLAGGQVLAIRSEQSYCGPSPVGCSLNSPTIRARRYNSDGSISSASSADVVVTQGLLHRVIRQPTGGHLFVSSGPFRTPLVRTSLRRLGEDGSVDTSFAANATAAESCRVDSAYWDERNAVVLALPDGKTLLVQGIALLSAGKANVCVSRLNADGTRDQAFANGGTPILAWPHDGSYNSLWYEPKAPFSTSNGGAALLLQKSVPQVTGSRYEYLLIWLTAQGTIDTNRPDQGTTVAKDAPIAVINAAAMQADGKILLAGFPDLPPGNVNGDQIIDYSQPRVVRLNLQGGIDTTYGAGAQGYTPLVTFGKRLVPHQLHVAADGSVFIAGHSTDAGPVTGNEVPQFAIGKLQADPPPVQPPASQNNGGGGGGGGCGVTRDPRIDPMLPTLAMLALLALASRRKRNK